MASSKNLKQEAYILLKNKILSNEFKPNEYLEEKKLSELTGMSRTPVREAVNRLAQEDLITIIPNKGIFVTELSIQYVKELFEARILLEPIVLQKAIDNFDLDILMEYKQKFRDGIEKKDYPLLHKLDYDFHNYLHSCCRNIFLIRTLNSLQDQFQRVRTQEFFSRERTENGAEEHIQLIDYFIQKNIDDSVKLMKKHIENTRKYYFLSLM